MYMDRKTALVREQVLLQIPRSPEYVSLVRHAVGGLAHRLRFTSQDVTDLQLAVGEACNNAVKHSDNGCDYPVRIRCTVGPRALEIEVRNRYCGVPPQRPIGCCPDPNECSEGGMGVYIMKTLMDRVHFRWGKSTATVRLTKKLPRPS